MNTRIHHFRKSVSVDYVIDERYNKTRVLQYICVLEDDSLEQTIREESTMTSLPILTIANVRRIPEKTYRELCADRLIEILLIFVELPWHW